jgi:hypothetical protein
LRLALIAVAVVAGMNLEGQSPKSLEICGVPFTLGMTRADVEKKLYIPAAKPEVRREFVDIVLGRQSAMLSGQLLGLPAGSDCSGTLYFKGEDVIEIEQLIASTSDAMELVNVAFLELTKLTGGDTGKAVIALKKVRFEEQTTQLASQIIFVSINGYTVKIANEQGNLEGHKIGPVAKVSVSIAKER